MKLIRLFQIVNVALFVLFGAAAMFASFRQGGTSSTAIVIAVVMFALAIVMGGIFELAIRAAKQKGRRVRAAIDQIATAVFDAPAAVVPGYDLTVTLGNAMGAYVSAFDYGDGFTTTGHYRGVRVAVASHLSTAGRQIGEMSHVYSYVAVDVLGETTRFRLTKQGLASALGNAAGVMHDVRVGDMTFDTAWNVDTDEALAREVLTPTIRARLLDLQNKVSLVSQDWGVGTMSVVLTSKGLALRWPGEMSLELAQYIRDLLIDIRGGILAHVERKARGAGEHAKAGYRIAGDAAAPAAGEPLAPLADPEPARLAAKA